MRRQVPPPLPGSPSLFSSNSGVSSKSGCEVTARAKATCPCARKPTSPRVNRGQPDDRRKHAGARQLAALAWFAGTGLRNRHVEGGDAACRRHFGVNDVERCAHIGRPRRGNAARCGLWPLMVAIMADAIGAIACVTAHAASAAITRFRFRCAVPFASASDAPKPDVETAPSSTSARTDRTPSRSVFGQPGRSCSPR